jgi:hypothetical protein
MLRNVMTVKRGLLVGAAVGVAVVVLWRRSREAADVVAATAPPEPPAEQPVRAEEPVAPVAETAPVPAEERVTAVAETHTETETLESALAHHRSAAAHAHRPVALTHVGRPRELGSAEWPQPRPAGALSAAGRAQTPLARASWPGVAGGRRGAFTRGR